MHHEDPLQAGLRDNQEDTNQGETTAGAVSRGSQRKEDVEIRGIFEKREGISANFLDRMELLNKRRKRIEKGSTLVYGEETRETHLAESLKISELVPKEIRFPALIHDVGKTGPLSADVETSKVVMALFAAMHKLEVDRSLLKELVKIIYPQAEDRERALILLKDIGVEVDKPLKDFYQMHVEWGRQIMEAEPALTGQEKYFALNHHRILRGLEVSALNQDGSIYQPRELDDYHATYLEICDYYQACISRRDNTHSKTIIELRKVFLPLVESSRQRMEMLGNIIDEIDKKGQSKPRKTR